MTDDNNPTQSPEPASAGNTTFDLRGAIERAKARGRLNQDTSEEAERVKQSVPNDESETQPIDPASASATLDNRAYFDEKMLLCLDAIEGDASPIRTEVSGELVVGRADNVTNYMPDIDLTPHGAYRLGLSRRHAIILREADALVVKDLGSRNGTYVNGIQLTSGGTQRLKDGDEVRFGNLTLNLSFQQK